MTITLIISLFFLIAIINASELRYLQDSNVVYSNSTVTVPLFIMPKCKSDEDCSLNGYCQMNNGICKCSEGYKTFISTERLLELRLKYESLNNTNKTLVNNSLNWDIINLNPEDVKFCNYQQKKQLTAFLLSLLVGFGTEHFYLGNFKVAAAKIVFFTVCGALNLVYFILYKCVKDGKKYTEFIGVYEAFYLSCGFLYVVLWTVYDLVHIGYNSYTDGFGFPMLPWNSTAK